MEQKQCENEEYIARKNAEIVELEKEHEELKRTNIIDIDLDKKAEDLKSAISDMQKLIISNQKSAEKSIAALEEQMQTVAVKYVDIGKSLNERMDSLLQTSMEGILQIQTVMEQTALLTANNTRISNVQDNFDTKLINISAKLENLEGILMNKLEWKEYGTILVLGGKDANKMHLLNRDRTRWSTLTLHLPTSLNSGGAFYLDGEIYIFGGERDKKTYKLSREMKWIQLADMNEERRGISNSSVAFEGCIWVLGGRNRSKKLNSVEKYIPEDNKWIQMPSMNQKRDNAAAAACKGKIFVCGGVNADSNLRIILRSMECFDPTNQKWTMFLDLPSPTWMHAMISDGICLTVLGGTGDQTSVWKINPNEEKPTWKKLPPMRESRMETTANLLGDKIFAIGGGMSEKVEFLNGETWEYGPELPESIRFMRSVVIPAHLADALSSHQ